MTTTQSKVTFGTSDGVKSVTIRSSSEEFNKFEQLATQIVRTSKPHDSKDEHRA